MHFLSEVTIALTQKGEDAIVHELLSLTAHRFQIAAQSKVLVPFDNAWSAGLRVLPALRVCSLWPLSSWWQWNRCGMCPPPLPTEQQNWKSSSPSHSSVQAVLCELSVVHVQWDVGRLLLLYLPNEQGNLLLALDIYVWLLCWLTLSIVPHFLLYTIHLYRVKWPNYFNGLMTIEALFTALMCVTICSITPGGVQTKYSMDKQEVIKCYQKNVTRNVYPSIAKHCICVLEL